MRAFPEYARAAVADREAVVALVHARWQPRRDLRLVDRTQRRVAAQAARERPCRPGEVEPIEHLVQLHFTAQRTHVAAVGDAAALEQLAVPRQHDAPLRGRQALDLV